MPVATAPTVVYTIEVEREDDGRWIADVMELPGVMAYGKKKEEAIARAQALAYRVLADKIEEQRTPQVAVRFVVAKRATLNA